jgi:hypothetical protein
MLHVLNFLRDNNVPNSFTENEQSVKFKIGHLSIETTPKLVFVKDEPHATTTTYKFHNQTLEVRSIPDGYPGKVVEFVESQHSPEEFLAIFHQRMNFEFGRIKEKVLRKVEVFDISDPTPVQLTPLSGSELELALREQKGIEFLLGRLRPAVKIYSELSFFASRWGENQTALERVIEVYSRNKAGLKTLGKFFTSHIDDWSVLVDFLRRNPSLKEIFGV